MSDRELLYVLPITDLIRNPESQKGASLAFGQYLGTASSNKLRI